MLSECLSVKIALLSYIALSLVPFDWTQVRLTHRPSYPSGFAATASPYLAHSIDQAEQCADFVIIHRIYPSRCTEI